MANYSNTNYTRKHPFLWDNQFINADYTAGSSAVTLAKGTVMGRVTTTGKVAPYKNDATDGTQVPLGVLSQDYEVGASATISVNICVAGEVDETLLVFPSGETLTTAVTGGIVRDMITRNTNIVLKHVASNTAHS